MHFRLRPCLVALSMAIVSVAEPGPASGPAAEPRAVAGAVLHLQMHAPSLGGAQRKVQVYLPPSYSAPDSAGRSYPVIYMLHGWPGSEGNWFGLAHGAETADSMIANHTIPEVILVSPNGSGLGFLGRSLYLNSYDGASRVADYILHDVVEWTDARFRTRRGPRTRGIIGLSDGASAALILTFLHPDVFGACGGHSGEYRLTRDWTLHRVLGPEPYSTRLLAENSPTLVADTVASRLRGVPIYFDVGISDESLEDNREFHRKLDSLGVAHAYREFSGTHDWSYWRTHLHESLIAVTSDMR
jgi:enterochelin esterase-like enzyme